MKSKSICYSVLCTSLVFSLAACTSPQRPMQVSAQEAQAPQGFNNIKDIPLPQTATVDSERSMIVGSGDSWTGQLVYNTSLPSTEVVDFINNKMQAAQWTKISEMRGPETVFSFMKNKRVATVVVKNADGYMSNKSVVSVGMANSHTRITEKTPMPQVESVIEQSS